MFLSLHSVLVVETGRGRGAPVDSKQNSYHLRSYLFLTLSSVLLMNLLESKLAVGGSIIILHDLLLVKVPE